MSQGLKNLQTAARSCARRGRMLSPDNGDRDDSGIGLSNDFEADYDADGASNCSELVSGPGSSYIGYSHTIGDSGIGLEDTFGVQYDASGRSTIGSEFEKHCSTLDGYSIGLNEGELDWFTQGSRRWPSTDMGIDAIINRARIPSVQEYTVKNESELEAHKETHHLSSLHLAQPCWRPNNSIEHQGIWSHESFTLPPMPAFLSELRPSNQSSASISGEAKVKTEDQRPPIPVERNIDRRESAENNYVAADFNQTANEPTPVEDSEMLSTTTSFSESPDANGNESNSEPDCYEPSLAVRQFFSSLAVTGVFRQRLMHQLSRIFTPKITGIGEASFRQCTSSSENTSPNNSSTPISFATSNANGTNSQGKTTCTKKRLLDEDDGDDDQDDKEGGKRPRREPPKPAAIREKRNRFSCPYHKHDPQSFGPTTAYSFCGGSWPDISKLK
jgi:hypothetical protein